MKVIILNGLFNNYTYEANYFNTIDLGGELWIIRSKFRESFIIAGLDEERSPRRSKRV
ncbi:hypothetical protein L3i20_v202380 [Paenibacillus sp. L3-i20]|nr:hypothetical protein L3i20_v202380 [Paenibacillus sp. L3-i20]